MRRTTGTIVSITLALLFTAAATYWYVQRQPATGASRELRYPTSQVSSTPSRIHLPDAGVTGWTTPVGNDRSTLNNIYVVASAEAGYIALAGTDPADGCTIVWDEAAANFLNPCLGNTYAADGTFREGRDERAKMTVLPTKTDGSDLVIYPPNGTP